MDKEIRIEEAEKPLLKDQYREDQQVFLNFSKEESSKFFGFKIKESEKDEIK